MSASAVGPSLRVERVRPRRRALERVARAHEVEVGDEPQRPEVLDRLVGRPVFAEVDAVVREDEDRLQVRERREADRRAHVVAEDEERRAERDEPVGDRHAVHERAHGVLADAEVDVAPLELSLARAPPSLRCTSSSRG